MKKISRLIPLSFVGAATVSMAVALVPAKPAYAYGDSAWGYSYDTMSDMIQADIMNRSIRASQDAAGITDMARAADKTTPAPSTTKSRTTTSRATSSPSTTTARLAPRSSLDVRAALNAAGTDFARGQGVDDLAAGVAKDKRAEFRNFMTRGIIAYGDAGQKIYGLPSLNLSTGVTALIAGSYSAYSGRELTQAQIKGLQGQMEQILRAEPDITNASLDAKATSYQSNMGMGLLLQATVLPDSGLTKSERAKARQLGKSTLEGLFGVPVDQISFTNSGVQLSG
ncbi:MAG: DUF6683 family protein [Sphingomonadaceae bacterium]